MFGIVAYGRLPISDLPTVDYPTISVSASLPGASPQTMAAAVATPLEKQFSTIAGIDNMTSTSSLGSTSITLQFSLDRDIDAAAQDVQAAIAKTLRQLPLGISRRRIRRRIRPRRRFCFFALTSTTLSLPQLDEVGETMIVAAPVDDRRRRAGAGVRRRRSTRCASSSIPTALAYRKIGIDEVADAINAQNVSQPTGVLWGPTTAYTLQATGQLNNAAAIPIDDASRIATARRCNSARSGSARRRREQPKRELVQRRPRDRARGSAAARHEHRRGGQRRARRARLDEDPDSGRRTQSRRCSTGRSGSSNRCSDVKRTLLLTLVLVVVVIFLFLRNAWATLIPSLALPLSIVGTFPVMYVLGYSLDTLSLMALTLAVGFVVDDAIVMLENIVRHMEMGKPPMQAAIDGAAEVGFTILSMTLSLTAVFIPLLFLGGVVGRLFREFAVVIATAILVSGVVSLTFTPMLVEPLPARAEARAAQPVLQRDRARVRLAPRPVHVDARLDDAPSPARDGVLARSCSSAPALLFKIRADRFHPDAGHRPDQHHDRGGAGHVVRRHGASPADDRRRSCRATPTSQAYMSTVGGGGSSATNTGRLTVILKPLGHRPRDSSSRERAARESWRACPGSRRIRRSRRRFRSADASRRASTSSRCRAPTSRRCTRRRRSSSTPRRRRRCLPT